MSEVAKIFAVFAVLYLIKTLLFPIYRPAGTKQKKRVRQYVKARSKELSKRKKNEHRRERIRKYGHFLLTDGARVETQKLLDRLDMDAMPEEIRIKQFTFAGIGALSALVGFALSPLLGYASIVLVVLLFLLPMDDLSKKIRKKEENIARDFPAFYSMVYYQYSRTVHIHFSEVIKDYLPNANEDLAKELGMILDDIEYGEEYALKQFKKRVQIHYVVKFCDIMETRLRGYDNTSQMLYFKNEIDAFRLESLEKELKKRQTTNGRLQLTLLIILCIYIVVYFLFNVLSALKMFQ